MCKIDLFTGCYWYGLFFRDIGDDDEDVDVGFYNDDDDKEKQSSRKNIEFLLALGRSSSQIFLALGKSCPVCST